MLNIRKFLKALKIIPKASTEIDAQGELEVLSTDGKLRFHNGTTVSPVVTEAHSGTLTNKTIAGGSNTISDIANGSLSTMADQTFKANNAGSTTTPQDVTAANVKTMLGVSGTNSGDVSLTAVGASPNANAASLSGQALTLQPADATNPGVVTTGTQTFAGDKTFSGANISAAASTNIDLATSNTVSTVDIGTGSGANTINIGGATSTVNFTGTVNNNNVTNLNVTDKLITINDGGGAGSGGNSGFEIEENGSATGYLQTSTDRNSFDLKAPNTAGVATITPGAGGITLNQSSHDAVTFATVGSSPAAGGASLSGQQITLQPADATNGGVVSTGAQTIAGVKTFNATPLLKTALDIEDPGASSNKITLQAPTLGASYTLTLPVDDGLNTQVLKTDGAGVLSWTDGGGGGGVNFISAANSKFAQGTVGDWLTFDDGAVSTPIDGTGGSPSLLTISASSSSPLEGTYSLLITKGSGDAQGEGTSLSSIAIDPAYRGKNCTFSAYLQVASGTYVQGDAGLWLYDQTNNQLLVADISSIPGSDSSNSVAFAANVSIPSNCASVRLIYMQTVTTSAAYTMKLDIASISPVTTIQGAAIGDTQDWTPTGTFTTNTTYIGKWRRVGERLEAEVKLTFAGAPNSISDLTINLPSGLVIDTTKLANGGASNYTLGRTNIHQNATGAAYTGVVRYKNTTSVYFYAQNASATYVNNTSADITQTVPITYAVNDTITGTISVPIVGWSSNIALANSRVEYASNSGMGDADDTTSFVNDINGSLIPTVSYTAEHVKTARFQSPIQPTDTIQLQVKTAGGWMDMGESFYSSGSSQTINSYDPIAGTGFGIGDITNSTDVRVFFSRYPYNTTNWSASNTSRWRVVKYSNAVPVEVAGPVAARYTSSNSSSITGGAIVDYNTKVYDTHNAVTTGASWKFTAPIAGYYSVKIHMETASAVAWSAVNKYAEMYLYKNGVLVSTLAAYSNLAVDTAYLDLYGTDDIYLSAGDYIHIDTASNNGNAISTGTLATYNWIAIARIG